MNTRTIAPVSQKLKRATEHYLDGKPVYIERDRGDGTVLITNDPNLSLEANYWTVLKSDLKTQPKYNTTLKVVAKAPATDEKAEKKDLNAFFDSLTPTFNCQSCRRALYAINKPAKRACSAHILAKSKYPSVAKNPDNIIFLGCQVFGSSCNCHAIFDSTVEKRMQMPVYELALKRFELLKPFLTDKELIMAEEDLGIRAKSSNLLRDIQEGGKVNG